MSIMKFKFGVYSSFGLIVFSVLKGQTDTYQIGRNSGRIVQKYDM